MNKIAKSMLCLCALFVATLFFCNMPTAEAGRHRGEFKRIVSREGDKVTFDVTIWPSGTGSAYLDMYGGPPTWYCDCIDLAIRVTDADTGEMFIEPERWHFPIGQRLRGSQTFRLIKTHPALVEHPNAQFECIWVYAYDG